MSGEEAGPEVAVETGPDYATEIETGTETEIVAIDLGTVTGNDRSLGTESETRSVRGTGTGTGIETGESAIEIVNPTAIGSVRGIGIDGRDATEACLLAESGDAGAGVADGLEMISSSVLDRR